MPAYNEQRHIRNNLLITRDLFKKAKCSFEIILVDDGSQDDTYDEASRVAKEDDSVKVFRHLTNHGKGGALQTGFRQATGDFVVFLDSDLDLPPEQLRKLFRMMRDEEADVLIGSKWHPDAKIDYPRRRKIISKIYAFALWLLFRLPLKDTQTGLKIFRYEVLKKVFDRVLCKRFAFDVEILTNAHRLGYKIVEAPVILNFRRQRRWGKITIKDMYNAGVDTLAIFYRMYILRYYDRGHQDT
jgi:glycosyltransferase involved in cell wall biosynthesis